jgi:hypothetical protein
MIYHLLDIFFVVFHTSLMIFNTAGWIFRRLRLWNLVTLLLTGSSWLILGSILGSPGYCPLTDWHFSVLEKLGKTDLPYSYTQYLAERISGREVNAQIADKLTLVVYILSLAASVIVNLTGYLRSRNKRA